MDQGDSPASARTVDVLHQCHRELCYQVTNLQSSVQSFTFDQGFYNQTTDSLVERCNILSTEVRLLQQALANQAQAAQVERDALHLRVRFLEQRLSTVECHLDLNSLD